MESRSEFEVRLSKSRFVAGVQCLKMLYLQVHEPELAAEPGEATEAILNQGTEVGAVARRGFPGGVTVEADYSEIDSALERTRQLIADVRIPAIFEAAFRHRGVAVRVDILERLPRNRWRLIEVKSTTGVKDHHLYDVAIQRHVVSRCGINVTAACLIMEGLLGLDCDEAVCPHCGKVNMFATIEELVTYVCSHCGGTVDADETDDSDSE
jgi:hypothetical protein